jgi:hypothetical protein
MSERLLLEVTDATGELHTFDLEKDEVTLHLRAANQEERAPAVVVDRETAITLAGAGGLVLGEKLKAISELSNEEQRLLLNAIDFCEFLLLAE